MRNIATLTALAAALAFGSTAFANEPTPPIDPSAPTTQSDVKPTFDELDTNKDGQVSKTEIPVEHELNTLFASFDRDTDQMLSRVEFDEYAAEDEEEAE